MGPPLAAFAHSFWQMPRLINDSSTVVQMSKGVTRDAGMEREEAVEAVAKEDKPRGTKRPSSSEGILQPVKLCKAELYKPPTNEELSHLKETENLFHSNLLRLQVWMSWANMGLLAGSLSDIKRWATGGCMVEVLLSLCVCSTSQKRVFLHETLCW